MQTQRGLYAPVRNLILNGNCLSPTDSRIRIRRREKNSLPKNMRNLILSGNCRLTSDAVYYTANEETAIYTEIRCA